MKRKKKEESGKEERGRYRSMQSEKIKRKTNTTIEMIHITEIPT